MEIELQSLSPISPPETVPITSTRENSDSESQSLITDRTHTQHQNDSENYYSLQEIVTETPNQREADNIRSDTAAKVLSEELWRDGLYNAALEVANLMKLSDDLKAEFTKETASHEFEDIDSVRDEPATPDDVNQEFPIRNTDLICFGLNETQENTSWSILHLASSYASEKVVSRLLLAGADPLARDTFGRTALDVAGCNLYEMLSRDCDNISALNKINEWSRVINTLLLTGVTFNIRAFLRLDTRFYSLLLAEIIHIDRKDPGLVKDLLDAGAIEDPSYYITWDIINKFVKKEAKEELQLLLNKYENTIHVNIIFQYAVREGWMEGVRLTLLAGTSVVDRIFTLRQTNHQSNFKTGRQIALHFAARVGNTDILKLILAVAKFKTTRSENYDELCQSFPDAPESLESRRRYFEKLHQYTVSFTDLINLMDGYNRSALHYTVRYKRLECFKIILENGASLSCTERTLLHLAVEKNDIDIAKCLIDHDESLVQATDELGREPLHIACDCGHKQMIFLLVRNGSDLSKKDKLGITPIHIINYKFTNPKAFIKELFDSNITCEHSTVENTNYYKVDCRIITPKDKEQEFDVIQNLITVKQAELLTHPIIESFIHLEWYSFVYLYWVVITIHVIFIFALNLYIVPLYYYRDKKEEIPMYLNSIFWLCIIYIAAVFYVVDNIFSMQEMYRMYTRRFILPFRVWTKLVTTLLYVCLPIALLWETTATSDACRYLATLAVLISLFDILCLISITFDWGFYVQIIGTVAWKVLKLFLIFGLIIVGFSLVFMIQFRGQEPFTNPLTAFMKTFAMKNTEYEYSSTYNATNASELTMATFIQNATFVAFVVLGPLTCFALINSSAINDLGILEKTGNITILEKKAAFLASLENNVCKRYLKKKMISLFSNWRRNNTLVETVNVRNNNRTENYLSAYPALPKRIEESIIDNVQSRLELLEREKKTDEINLDAKPSAFSRFEVVIKLGGDPPSWKRWIRPKP